MVIDKEFIWKKDHYVFHITNTDAMASICSQGLIPLCGERSKSVNDNTKGIFFFDALSSVSDWVNTLYETKDIYELELLRFNIKNRSWKIQSNDPYGLNEFYLIRKVLPEKIEYLRIYDTEKNMYLPLNYVDDYKVNKNLVWNSLDHYNPLIKSK